MLTGRPVDVEGHFVSPTGPRGLPKRRRVTGFRQNNLILPSRNKKTRLNCNSGRFLTTGHKITGLNGWSCTISSDPNSLIHIRLPRRAGGNTRLQRQVVTYPYIADEMADPGDSGWRKFQE